MILFAHVPRTAGTSFRQFFIHLLGRKQVFWQGVAGNRNEYRGIGQIPENILRGYLLNHDIVGGHFSLAHPKIDGLFSKEDDVIYSCLLREPFERLVSHFELATRKPGHPAYTRSSFLEAFEKNEAFFLRNHNQQNRYISNRNQFDLTKQFLENHRSVVGIHEQRTKFIRKLGQFLPQLNAYENFPCANSSTIDYEEKYAAFRDNTSLAKYLVPDYRLYRWVADSHDGLFCHV